MKMLLPRRPLPVCSSGRSPLLVRRMAKKRLGTLIAKRPLGSRNVFISTGGAGGDVTAGTGTGTGTRTGESTGTGNGVPSAKAAGVVKDEMAAVVAMVAVVVVVRIEERKVRLFSFDWNKAVGVDDNDDDDDVVGDDFDDITEA